MVRAWNPGMIAANIFYSHIYQKEVLCRDYLNHSFNMLINVFLFFIHLFEKPFGF